jgi:transcriptional regulator with XRE-family HTH domain
MTLAQKAAGRPRPQDIDRHVGVRLRDRRIVLGMTQHQLADLIGVTHQQQHRYEKGMNRMSVGRLQRVAGALGVQVSYFYEGLTNDACFAAASSQRMTLDTARSFLNIRDRSHQGTVVSLARAVAEIENGSKLAVLPEQSPRWRSARRRVRARVGDLSGYVARSSRRS